MSKSSLNTSLNPLDVALEEEEILLVQATNLSMEFLTVLSDMEVDWEFVAGTPWIQLELASVELQILIDRFPNVVFDILA
jgi:hypothetical protein